MDRKRTRSATKASKSETTRAPAAAPDAKRARLDPPVTAADSAADSAPVTAPAAAVPAVKEEEPAVALVKEEPTIAVEEPTIEVAEKQEGDEMQRAFRTLPGGATAAADALVRRIKLGNVNKYFTKKEAKKWLEKVPAFAPATTGAPLAEWLQKVQIKKSPKAQYAFLTLPNDTLHTEAMAALTSTDLLCKNAEVTVAEFTERVSVREAPAEDPNDTRTPLERVADQTSPLWRMPYAEQLQEKHSGVLALLKGVVRDAKIHDAPQPPLLPPVASPVQDGYRTKCEFQIGTGTDGLPTVGFFMGSFLSGHRAVVSARGLKHVSETMLKATDILQAFIRASPLAPMDRVTKLGFFRLALMRATSLGQTMLVLQLGREGIDPVVSAAEVARFHAFYVAEAAKVGLPVTVLGIQYFDGINDMFSPTDPVELLVGDAPTIDEALCGFTFKISPTSFFQVNKPATEVLYGMVRDWALGDGGNTSAKTEKRRVLLDLCCGTGTIGVCMSSGGFDKIVGIDIVADAVADARVNAARNGVSNAEYTAGDVGKVVPRLLESLQIETPHGQELELIAVLDPPRSGVPKSVVKAIRACPAISRVVYVSCDLKQAQGNLVDLMRSPTGQLPGVAFTMHQAAVVDMFPHTRHYETVMEFRRPLAPSSSTEESEKEAEKEDE